MATLAELKAKYNLGDGAKYEPFADCKFCRGTGEKSTKRGDVRFCICLFVDHKFSDWAGDSLAETARKIAKEMKDE